MATKKASEKKASATTKPTPDAKPKGFRVLALRVENIKRISFAQIRPKGNTILVGGKNGQGKTSLLDALSWALTGERQLPSNPISLGKNSGKVQVDMGEYQVERTFTRVHGGKEPFLTRLAVYGKDRRAYPSPQSVIDKLRGVISFDPLKFLQMPADKQLETVRKLSVLDIDLDELDARKKVVYDERRDAGRDENAAKARLAAMPEPPAELPTKFADPRPLIAQMDGATKANEARAEILRQKKDLEDKAQRHRDNTADLQNRDAEIRKQIAELEERAENFKQRAKDEDRKAQECDDEADKVQVPETVDNSAALHELEKVNALNAQIQKAEQYRVIEKELKDAEAKWTELDTKYKAMEKEREEAIARAKMPIDKLGIGEGEVLFQGLPFSQASNAEQIRVAVAMAIASNPELRVLRIMDGSLLDEDSLAMIEKMAEEGDFQVWIERVGSEGKVGVIMTNGEASGDEAEQVAP